MTTTQARLDPDPAPRSGDSSSDGIIIRRAAAREEYDECARIQDETWGAGFTERVPSTIFSLTQYLGGVTAAAFSPENGRMLGFVFGMTGVREGRLVHWSDLLAVRPEARDRGIGRRLKQFQRSAVLPLGVTRMLWTFDPLVAKNAHLNLNALGARISEYVPDMYGADTGSALHSAVGTDRFIVAWDLTTESAPDAHAKDASSSPPESLIVNRVEHPGAAPTVHTADDLPELYVAVPDDIQKVIAGAPELARAWRQTTRQAFLWYLERGYRVDGFHRAEGRGFYHLARPPG